MGKCPFSIFQSKKGRVEEVKPSVIQDHTESPFLRVRRLHPTQGIKIVPANSKLIGPDGQNETEHNYFRSGAIKRCGPYVHANSLGWWIFPAVDLDATYHPNGEWTIHEYNKFDEIQQREYLSSLPPYEYKTESGETRELPSKYLTRNYVNAGLADENILQIWTGVILRTPPGWGLLIRSPINVEEDYDRSWYIQEGVIESDWMDYDIWTNIVFKKPNQKVEIRQKMWPPLAQIVPIRREAYDTKWDLDDQLITADDPEFASWQDYNFKKWTQMNEKESRTYYKERAVQKPRPDDSKVESLREKYATSRNEHQVRKDVKKDSD